MSINLQLIVNNKSVDWENIKKYVHFDVLQYSSSLFLASIWISSNSHKYLSLIFHFIYNFCIFSGITFCFLPLWKWENPIIWFSFLGFLGFLSTNYEIIMKFEYFFLFQIGFYWFFLTKCLDRKWGHFKEIFWHGK